MRAVYLKIKTLPKALPRYKRHVKPVSAIVVGFLVPLMLFKILVTFHDEMPPTKTVQKRDTVFVKLLNGQSMSNPSTEIPPPKVQGTAENNLVNTNENTRAFALTRPPKIRALKIEPIKLPVTKKGSRPEKGWLILLVLLILIALWVIRNSLVRLNPVREKEQDPEELKELLRTFSTKINTLGTPRKIKRFANKVRFQYYILTEKSVVNHSNANAFIKTLIYIEQSDIITKISCETDQTAFNSFKKEVQQMFDKVDDALVRQLYILNRGNLI